MGGMALVGGGGGSSPPPYSGKLTWYVGWTAVAAAMGGLIFGYDIGISGGVTSMAPFLIKFFPEVYRKQAADTSTNQYCKFNSPRLQLFTSSLYLAALVASISGAAKVSQKYGRRMSMMVAGLIFLAGALLNAFSRNIAMLIAGRILLGIGVGFANQSVPMYLSEMSPYNYRGTFNVMFQLMITLGILVANLINYFTAMIDGDVGWRLSLGLAGVPAALMLFALCFLSDTPNSLVERGKEEEAKSLLKRIRGADDVETEFIDLLKARDESRLHANQNSWNNFLFKTKSYRPPLVTSVLVPFFQQFTGINVIMFYAPVLFKSIGFGSKASLASALITGFVNVVATLISVYGTDRWGRRNLFLGGGAVMLVFQAVVAALIGAKFGTDGNVVEISKGFAAVVVVCICMYVSAFACSWGPLGWLYPSEVLPLEVRSKGMSVVVAVNMLFTFVIGQCFLSMLCAMKFGLFIFFAVFVLAMTVYCCLFMPETKNIPIEEMSKVWRVHWYWKRFMNDPTDTDPATTRTRLGV